MARSTTPTIRLVLLAALMSLLALTNIASTHAQTPSCGPRVRKAWNKLSTADKQLYLDAVMAAMANGNHALFLEVHGDPASGNEAHRTCGMIYWHRRFLLAYENMLRSLEPRFACITIPYWDYFTDYTKRLANECNSFETCANILNDFGGSIGSPNTNVFTATPQTTLTGSCVDGSQVPASLNLSTTFSLAGLCQNSTLTNCWGCIPRDNWAAKAFPSGFGLSTIARYISGSLGFAWFAQNIHYGVHNSIHNTMGSTMATLWSAADPIFYNHHSTIDLLHQMWYDCQVQRPMTDLEKKTSIYAFQPCAMTLFDICPTSLSTITQYWPNITATGTTRIRVEDHPVLGQFFAPLPTKYWQYVSGTDLGDYSYEYEKDSLLTALSIANINIGCPLLSLLRRLEDVTESFTTVESLSSAPQASVNLFTELVNTSLAEVVESQPTLSTANRKSEALVQVELMHCAWYLEQEGFVDDYTAYFRSNHRLPSTQHTPCVTRTTQLRTGEKTILVSDWRTIYMSHLTTTATYSVSAPLAPVN